MYITPLYPIDLWDPVLERQHRHSKPQWMNYFNRQQPQHQHPLWNRSIEFWPDQTATDTHALWLINHDRLPQEWRWHTESFQYSHNAQGFRTPDNFDDIDWSQATVLFGASVAACDGVPWSESITHYTQQITGQPAVCVGVPGASCEVVYNNVITMLHRYGRPRAVHIMWPEAVRCIDELELVVDADHTTWLRKDRGAEDVEPHHISSGTCFYRRNLILWSVRLLLQGVEYAETFDNWVRVRPGVQGHRVNDQGMLEITTPFPDTVHDEIAAGTPYHTWSDQTKLWYINNYCARDIAHQYDGASDPEYGTHNGWFVNRALAQHFVHAQQML